MHTNCSRSNRAFLFRTLRRYDDAQLLRGAAGPRRHRSPALVERAAVGDREAAGQGLHTADGADALLSAAQAGPARAEHRAVHRQSAAGAVAAQLRDDHHQAHHRRVQVLEHRADLLRVRLGGDHVRECREGGK